MVIQRTTDDAYFIHLHGQNLALGVLGELKGGVAKMVQVVADLGRVVDFSLHVEHRRREYLAELQLAWFPTAFRRPGVDLMVDLVMHKAEVVGVSVDFIIFG